jgi:pSer/pThr/pTyr-binding forkhead associated (FHA) protein
MSSTTLVLAITGGIFCGASVVGIMTVAYLWIQSSQRSQRLQNTMDYQPPINNFMTPPTMNPVPQFPPAGSASDHEPSVPSPYPPRTTPSPPAGVRVGSIWFDGVSGMVAGQRIMISKEETLIGRSGVCDVQFHDPKVSRQHALLRFYNNSYYIQDMQSAGGTFVNNQRVTSQILHDRDQVRIGDSVVVFRRQ